MQNNKNIVILGAGESGVGAALLAKAKGNRVFVSDFGVIKERYKQELENNEIPFEEQQHSEERILNAEVVVKSPGIPDHVPLVTKLLEKTIPVISEIEFAAQFTDAKIIAITGSNGKTTTTELLGHILKANLDRVCVAGNIGNSFAREVIEDNYDYYVLELSSFQLDGIVNFHPHIAILTNLSPDHLDRYNYKYENYIASKFRILMNQVSTDYFIYDFDNQDVKHYIGARNIEPISIPFSVETNLDKGLCLQNENLMIPFFEKETTLINTKDLSLKGKHNMKNSMAATAAAKLLGISKKEIRESLSNFKGVEHRLENVLKIANVQYINDSKATNVNATYYALEAVKSPIVWIVGGVDKGNDYSELYALVNEKVKAIVCLGIDNTKIISEFSEMIPNIRETQSMTEAVQMAHDLSDYGDTVLLSPCCSSFDLFKSYEHRGVLFKAAVQNL